MQEIQTQCPYCGQLFMRDIEKQECYCPGCSTKIVFNDDLKARKREENYKYAKRIGFTIIIILSVVAYFSEYIELPYIWVLPFAAEAFYPFPDEWGIVRKIWNCFLHGILRAVFWALLTFGILLLLSFVVKNGAR